MGIPPLQGGYADLAHSWHKKALNVNEDGSTQAKFMNSL